MASARRTRRTPVVVDAVSPVPEARHGWAAVATAIRARLRVIEVGLSDPNEHRRRVEQRRSDLEGLTVPTWEQVINRTYEPWDEHRDGPRLRVDNSDVPTSVLPTIRAYVDHD